MIDLDFVSQLGEGYSAVSIVLPINVINLYFLHVRVRIIFPLYLLCYRYYKLVVRSQIRDRGCNANKFFTIPVDSPEYPKYLSR